MGIGHETPAGANLFADLGFDTEEAENLRIRAALIYPMIAHIRGRKLKQREAAALFGVSQPRISDLTRGHIDTFTIDSLVNMLTRAGFRVDLTLSEPASAPEGAEAPPPRALRASG